MKSETLRLRSPFEMRMEQLSTMIEELIGHLSLNSIGLFVLGVGFLVTHFWNRRKSSKDSNVVVIDGISESLLSRLFRIKSLLIGIGFIAGAIIWGIQDYERSVMSNNISIINITHKQIQQNISIKESSNWNGASNSDIKLNVQLILKMEGELNLQILSKQIDLQNEKWISESKDLSKLYFSSTYPYKPICVKLFEIYSSYADKTGNYTKVSIYSRLYEDFLISYYGVKTYKEKIELMKIKNDYDF